MMTTDGKGWAAVSRGRTLPGDPRLWCLVLAFFLLGVVYTHPRRPMPQQTLRALFVIDITQSMNTRDLYLDSNPIDRLTLTKRTLQEIVRSLPCRSEMGLGIFTERRIVVLFEPLEVCRYRTVLISTLSAIDWRMAWEADSRIAEGVYDTIAQVKRLPPQTALLFFTDGQEAPPIIPGFEPRFEGEPGKVNGLIIGVGGQAPSEIPKFDEEGRMVGYWSADDTSRFASVGIPTLSVAEMEAAREEEMVGSFLRNAPQRQTGGPPTHLSWLHETYLMELAKITGLQYARLTTSADLRSLLLRPPLAHTQLVRIDIRWIFALGALALILIGYTIIPTIPIIFQDSRRNR